MFNVGGGEILLIALLALIVIGPEQLPGVLRKLGYYAGQARQMSNALRAEFMAGAEPFQESMREFRQGMTDFSHTVADAADPHRWGSGTTEDPVVPRGFADGEAGGPEDGAEQIRPPERLKKLEVTPPPNPWAPLPGSGAESVSTEPLPDGAAADGHTDDEPGQQVARAVPLPPPLTGYRGDGADSPADAETPETG